MHNCILLRYGEVGIKSNRTRPRFERLYKNSIAEAMQKNGIEYSLKNLGGRFVLHTEQTKDAVSVLVRIPGVQSLSPAVAFGFNDKEDLLEKATEIATPPNSR